MKFGGCRVLRITMLPCFRKWQIKAIIAGWVDPARVSMSAAQVVNSWHP